MENDMDKFGLTAEERKTNLHGYNHALFRNMMYFMDIVWEINMQTGTIFLLEDKAEPGRADKEFFYKDFFEDYQANRVKESDRITFRQYLTFENLLTLEKDVSFDIYMRSKGGEWHLHHVVITPAIDDNNTIYCVYLGAKDLQAWEPFRPASLSGTLLVCNANLTKNLIEDDLYAIVDGNRYPLLRLIDLAAPCSFDAFCEKWCRSKVAVDSQQVFLQMFNREYLLESYAKGRHHLELPFDIVTENGIPVTLLITMLLIKDSASGDILAMVHGRDISA